MLIGFQCLAKHALTGFDLGIKNCTGKILNDFFVWRNMPLQAWFWDQKTKHGRFWAIVNFWRNMPLLAWFWVKKRNVKILNDFQFLDVSGVACHYWLDSDQKT